jgi:hypothetical protein
MTNADEIPGSDREPANDNRYSFGRPLVRSLRRRPAVRYARSGNLILPLVFAERHPAWAQPAIAP